MRTGAIIGHIRSNAVGYLALFVLLGGTAWAATGTKVGSEDIRSNAVKQKHVANNAIGSLQIERGAVKASDIATAAIGPVELSNSSVTSAKVAGGAISGGGGGGGGSGTTDHIKDGSIDGKDVLSGAISGGGGGGGGGTDHIVNSSIGGADIDKAAIADEHFANDQANQAELDAHKGSGDHDGRYFTQPQLQASDGSGPNSGSNRMHWNNLLGVPSGLADGSDDVATIGDVWELNGNAGTGPSDFLGTTDDRLLELRVDNAHGLRLEPASDGTNKSPNVIGGIGGNQTFTGVFAATIAGGGRSNPSDSDTVNVVTDHRGTVGGGAGNRAGDSDTPRDDAMFATVAGGQDNRASGPQSTVGGGFSNDATFEQTTVGGGDSNLASAFHATVAGGVLNEATNSNATVGGGQQNDAAGSDSTVAGGSLNQASGIQATVGGGVGNTAEDLRATVGGGGQNHATDPSATVSGGASNTASASESTVGGGDTNTATAGEATVGGGFSNDATATQATVAGGNANLASGVAATVPGGELNEAAGDHSLAAGRRAKVAAAHDGSFLFADASAFDFASAAANELAVRATGGARIVSGINGTTGAPEAGVTLAPGGGSWGSLSDRASKTAITPVSGREVLDRLADVPMSTWSYEAQGTDVRHIGPMAQDFARAFGVGEDERHITSIDADGVALAAIKGLNERVDALDGDEAGAWTPPLPPLALAGIAALALALAAAMGAALALRWSRRGWATS